MFLIYVSYPYVFFIMVLILAYCRVMWCYVLLIVMLSRGKFYDELCLGFTIYLYDIIMSNTVAKNKVFQPEMACFGSKYLTRQSHSFKTYDDKIKSS